MQVPETVVWGAIIAGAGFVVAQILDTALRTYQHKQNQKEFAGITTGFAVVNKKLDAHDGEISAVQQRHGHLLRRHGETLEDFRRRIVVLEAG